MKANKIRLDQIRGEGYLPHRRIYRELTRQNYKPIIDQVTENGKMVDDVFDEIFEDLVIEGRSHIHMFPETRKT